MQTVTIEIDRLGSSHNHGLSPQTKYRVACDQQPVIEVSIDCDQSTFEMQKELLRNMNDEQKRQSGLTFCEALVTKIFDDIRPFSIVAKLDKDPWLHIRLLSDAKELVQLPFESAQTPSGLQGQHDKLLLLNPQRPATLTREVRQVDLPSYQWPLKPRILFAWANPGMEVPAEDHYKALRGIVSRLVPPLDGNAEPIPDLAPVLTRLPKASLQFLKSHISKASQEGNPYTHVHLLAHGIKDDKVESGIDSFLIALHDDNDETKVYRATGEELASALIPVTNDAIHVPTVVSLMTCDSANAGNITLPGGSLAHQLHTTGIPCVFASQFPLSIPGSVKLVEELYSKLLLSGEDPRKALYYTRKAIRDNSVNDWAALVAYMRFPDNFNQKLQGYKLNVLLKRLQISNAWSGHIIRYRNDITTEKLGYIQEDVEQRLDISIRDLTNLFEETSGSPDYKDDYPEHAGLVGSAYKRKAEHLFQLRLFKPELQASLTQKSKEALKAARDWYYNGFFKAGSHWTGIQYLSLSVVTGADLNTPEIAEAWSAIGFMAKQAAENDNGTIKQVWAWGTFIEYHLLQPLITKGDAAASLNAASDFASRLAQAKSTFLGKKEVNIEDVNYALATSTRQVERYISWWPQMLPSEQLELIRQRALEIRKVLIA